MKKQYLISLVVTCMVIFNVKAQNTPIDDFLKKWYPSMEGVTSVSMSQQMLQSIFTPPILVNSITGESMKVPEAYSSVTISKKDVPENLFSDFKKTLLFSKYEQFMEMNRENSSLLGYYMKKVYENTNEIVVLRHQKDQFSAIYIKGDIDINYVNHHLNMIRSALNRLGATNTGLYQPNNQFAFTMPSYDYNYLWNYKFDPEAFNFKMDETQSRMEEFMKKGREMLKSGDFQRKINDSMEEAQRQIEEKIKQMEEEQAEGL